MRDLFLVLVGLVAGAAACDSGGGSNLPPLPPGRGVTHCARIEPANREEVILFGDLHAHSTFSLDARATNLPLTGGTGEEGPAQRCDFARFCSRVDFWAITDHPEEQRPEQWAETVAAIRTCNELTEGYGRDPKMVSFLGWEWTQKGPTEATDWGHHNIVLEHTCDDMIPARPIAAPTGFGGVSLETFRIFTNAAIAADPDHEATYAGLYDSLLSLQEIPTCEDGVASPALPSSCHEIADDPAELFAKLDEWSIPALVIPHGKTWGANHPPSASWRNRFLPGEHDEDYENLVEIYSGHGNGESYRPWRHIGVAPDGSRNCPEPTPDFEPCCWRAGEIVRARSHTCEADPTGSACTAEVARARWAYVSAGMDGPTTVGDTDPRDWLDCGQCRDCFLPAFTHRPLASVQAALATVDFTDPEHPRRFVFGFVGSSDSHQAGPGAGYKEFREMTENVGPASTDFEQLVAMAGRSLYEEFDRMNSYYYGGGLAAVHALGRTRDAIWDAIRQRSVYATSGERILLWFDLLNGPDGRRLPMGSRVPLAETPRFEVRAIGALAQVPGCPAEVIASAPRGFTELACWGECYNPTSARLLITRIDVVKITPQLAPAEPLEALIRDPFRSFSCAPDPSGCTVTFDDPDYVAADRPAVYYVRAYQQPTPAFNARTLRCTRGADGRCLGVRICQGGVLGADDDCLADAEERAWASPIYVDPPDP